MVEVKCAPQARTVADPLTGLAVQEAIAVTFGDVGAQQGHINALHGGRFCLLGARGQLERIFYASILEFLGGIENVGLVIPEHAHIGIGRQRIDVALVGCHFEQARQVILILVPARGQIAQGFQIAGRGQFRDHEAVHQIDIGSRTGSQIQRNALIVSLPWQLDRLDSLARLRLEILDPRFNKRRYPLGIHERDFRPRRNGGRCQQRQRRDAGQNTLLEHELLLRCSRRLLRTARARTQFKRPPR